MLAPGSTLAAEAGTEELRGDEPHVGSLGIAEGEQGAAELEESGTPPSAAFTGDSTAASASFLTAFKALGLSLEILERSSVCVPLTALETVSRVFLTRDMCWLRLAGHRDAEVLK